MHRLLKHTPTWLLIVLAIILSISILMLSSKKVTYVGKVKEHFITSDRGGRPTYNTVALFNDGMYRTLSGLDYYVIPINGTVYYEIRVFE